MKSSHFYIVLFLFSTMSNIYAKCSWCLADQKEIRSIAENFLALSPSEQLKKIESEGVKIFILKADKEVPSLFFQWKKIRVDNGKLNDLSKYEGVLGKTLCAGEKDLSKNQNTIVLNADAPMSTLLHEYLHIKQINADRSWCTISKNLWNNKEATENELKALHDREWDVRKVLWQVKDHQSFNIEDQILISEGVINEGNWQLKHDPSVKDFIEKEKPKNYLNSKILEFQNYILNFKK